MKVILSVDSVRFPLTGIGRYTLEIASKLMQSAELSELKLFSGYHFVDNLPLVQEHADKQYRVKSLIQKSSILIELYRIFLELNRKHVLKNYNEYLYHGPNFQVPKFPGHKVATFHDLSPFTWAHCNTSKRIQFIRKEALNTLSSADALITDSNYTRQEIANYFNWPIERIHVVPLACSEEFRPRDATQCYPVLTKYGLTYQRYSLYVGTIEPRKNLLSLLDAYSKLPMTIRKHCPLILSGYKGWNNEEIFKRILVAEREGWARYLGYLPATELPILFSGARTFCFPSLYEGFGLPVLEAISSGVPVVCSNSSSLPEVVGDAGLMCAPEDVDKLTQLILQANEDEAWRMDAIEKGLQRAGQFSWSLCAENTIKVYQKVLQNESVKNT